MGVSENQHQLSAAVSETEHVNKRILWQLFTPAMLNNFKNRFISAIEPDLSSADLLPDKFPYGRPTFLQLLTADELRASANHNVRPIIVPRDLNLLPWGTGYAECINSGKSKWNEDQAAFCR